MRPRIFVGSSTEALQHDQLVRETLEAEGIEAVAWHSSFQPGEYGLDSLDRIAHEVDGALLITTADDPTNYRGQDTFSPRDNVLLELGYFLQAYGRRRTAVVQVQESSGDVARTPSDLAGLMTIRFQAGAPEANAAEIRRWAQMITRSMRSLDPKIRDIVRVLKTRYPELHPDWEDAISSLVLEPMRRSALAALRGELLLTPGQYYSRLDQEITDSGAGTRILAVSTVSSQVLPSDRDQQQYFERNIDAAARGAEIRRLFVLPERFLEELSTVMRRQQQAGIAVRVARPGMSADFSTLDDVVLFMRDTGGRRPYLRGYVGYPVFDNPGRIRSGKLLLDVNLCRDQQEAFEAAWALCSPIVEPSAVPVPAAGGPRRPPGETMTPRWLRHQVFSCREAAAARGVPLHNELKTLILETPGGLVAAHVPGDHEVDLAAVAEILEVDHARLAPRDALDRLGLTRGTVTPVLNPVWSLPHLIDRRVMKLEFLTTNNGSATGWVRFPPAVLLGAESRTLADFAIPHP